MKVERIVGEYLDSNVFVVGNDHDVVLIDASAKIENVKRVVANRKVLAILLTHGHYDHSVFANEYASEFGCKVYASGHVQKYLIDADWNCSDGHFAVEDFSKFAFLSGDGELDFGEIVVEYKSMGGHSLADMLYKIEDEIFVGDLLIGRDMGRIDLKGGDKKQMIESLKTLLAEKYTVMHSGHGTDNKKEVQDKILKLWIRFLDR